jgi:hypothetical protein
MDEGIPLWWLVPRFKVRHLLECFAAQLDGYSPLELIRVKITPHIIREEVEKRLDNLGRRLKLTIWLEPRRDWAHLGLVSDHLGLVSETGGFTKFGLLRSVFYWSLYCC